LCTDGDFNVGPYSTDELERLIERKRETGVYLSVLGFGTGNTKDNKMETLADKGNGNYAYIDTLSEAQKVLVNEAASTLFTVAKDVKLQIEFNPNAVKEYRLIGYDNRILNPEDFNNDRKDAGEMGAGHCVTAFYELALVGSGAGSVDDLVFQSSIQSAKIKPEKDWMYVKLRYKQPDAANSRLITVMAGEKNYTATPDNDFLFASAVTELALLLKNSSYAGNASFGSLIERARSARGADPNGYRAQFIQLAGLAQKLSR
jgi:Ca-activated chloride channel family protein